MSDNITTALTARAKIAFVKTVRDQGQPQTHPYAHTGDSGTVVSHIGKAHYWVKRNGTPGKFRAYLGDEFVHVKIKR